MRRFFCGNCGEEVDQRDELCPHCGAVFSAIKCPQCGYRGKLHEFHHGCPSCGFLGEHRVRDTGEKGTQPDRGGDAGGDPRGDVRNGLWARFISAASGRSGSKEPPAWLFWLILAVMVFSFAGLALVYMRL